MDAIAFASVVLAMFSVVAAIAGYESRDGFANTHSDTENWA
jgi:hypothetical protein